MPVCLTGLCLGLTGAFGQIIHLPPEPAWLGGEFPAPSEQFFRRDFVPPDPLLKAVAHLTGSADIRLELNESEIAVSTNAGGFDLTHQLKPGTNRIVLTLTTATSPPRLAFQMELNGGATGRRWMVSDTNWLTSADRKVWRPVTRAEPAEGRFPAGANFDAYNSWKLARETGAATGGETLRTLPGFEVELMRSAQPGEGSWIAMAFNDAGNIVLAREKRGLLLVELERFRRVRKVIEIDDTLEEVRGLLSVGLRLYAHANRGQELVVMSDRDQDGLYERRRTLLRTKGGFGHGRNKMQIGPDGFLYVAYGNNVELPPEIATNSPLRRFGEDRLIPCPWDRTMFDGRANAPGGFILRVEPRGSSVELYAGGLRNPMGIAASGAGELFTFDADNEGDVGTPWYQPNRVLQLVSGADYGWRRGTSRFPAYYPDSLPSVLDVGLASPTAVAFGPLERYPIRYQKALYLCDWAYGRILAVHLDNQNGTYRGTPELFVSGRPLNVTDLVAGPDERLWFITGGRNTQSGLYRINWSGDAAAQLTGHQKAERQELELTELRQDRKFYEQDHLRTRFDRGWESLRSAERPPLEPNLRTNVIFRHSQRIVLENWLEAADSTWVARLFHSPTPPTPDLLLALARTKTDVSPAFIITNLLRAPLAKEREPALMSTRTLALAFIRQGAPEESLHARALAWAEAAYPHDAWEVNHDLIELLVYLRSATVITATLPLLAAAERSEDLLQYLFYLRLVPEGWTLPARRAVFDALRRAALMPGAKNYHWAVKKIREEFVAALTPAERSGLAEFFANHSAPASTPAPAPRFVKAWEISHFANELKQPFTGRSFADGRAALVQAQCTTCHRVGSDPHLPAGLAGPDLSGVGGRFGPQDLLAHILEPSSVIAENYQATLLTLRDGEEITGQIEAAADDVFYVRQHPLAEATVRVPKAQVVSQKRSPVSTMPAGLLNSLTKSQILDLLAYLHTGGDADHAAFAPPAQPTAKNPAL